MGGSSSKEEQEKKRRDEDNKRFAQLIENTRIQLEQQRLEQQRNLLEAERRRLENERARLAEEQRQSQQRKREEELAFLNRLTKHQVSKNLDLINDIRKSFKLNTLSHYPTSPYEEKELHESSMNYTKISGIFKSSNKPYFNISKIIHVKNNFHVLHYNLMMNKYRATYDEDFQEILMFHGTKREFLDGICTYNFDRSKVRTHKFGFGTSFARDSFFATHYHPDNKRNNEKVMIIAKVSFGEMQQGTEYLTIPEEPCYTSTNEDISVIVKFDDASCYPLYIVYYEGLHPPKPNINQRLRL